MPVACEKITQTTGLIVCGLYNRRKIAASIDRIPVKAMFGENRYADLIGKELPNDVWEQLEGEEDLAEALGIGSVGEEERNEEVERSDNDNNR